MLLSWQFSLVSQSCKRIEPDGLTVHYYSVLLAIAALVRSTAEYKKHKAMDDSTSLLHGHAADSKDGISSIFLMVTMTGKCTVNK